MRKKGKRKARKPIVKQDFPSTSDFRLEIQERKSEKKKRKRKGKLKDVTVTSYRTIPQSDFRTDRYYRIYLVHRKTKQKRILGIGTFNNIPIVSRHPDTKGKALGGRWFRPNVTPIKRRGRWVPVSEIIGGIERELAEYGESYRHEVRGAIIPPKNYYHLDWQIFSDKPLPGNTVWKHFGINCVIEYVYTNQQWIGKHTVIVDAVKNGIQIRNLHKYKERWLFEISQKLDELKQNRRGEVNVIEINGFVPLSYIPGEQN